MKDRVASPTLHATVFFTIGAFCVLVGVSFVLRVEIVAKGTGKVIPSKRVQVIQSQYPGQISAIHVRGGDSVSQGQIVLELDPTEAQSRLNATLAEITQLGIERARIDLLVGEIQQDKLEEKNLASTVYSRFINTHEHPRNGFFLDQADLLNAEILEIQSHLAQLSTRMEANRRSETVTEANIERIRAVLAIQTERLDAHETLSNQGTVSRSQYLDVLEVFTALEKQAAVYERELEQKEALGTALLAERRNYLFALRSRHLQRKSGIEAQLAALQARRIAHQRQVNKMQLLAPVDGVVDQLRVFTVGGFADEGAPLMHIVPNDSNPEVEAVFPNVDIGFLAPGQKANIKLDAYPSARFGYVPGRVINVSADATEIQANTWAFVVRVQPDKPFLETPLTNHALRPGMTAAVDVVTGDRSLISYFFEPILKTIQESLGER